MLSTQFGGETGPDKKFRGGRKQMSGMTFVPKIASAGEVFSRNDMGHRGLPIQTLEPL
jgi:hypothetical protein